MCVRRTLGLLSVLALCCLASPSARADGFAVSLRDALVTNGDKDANGIASPDDTFQVTGARFSNYRSLGDKAPAITQNDLNRYSATFDGVVPAGGVTGNTVRYTGTFTIRYTGDISADVATGSMKIVAVYGPDGTATLTGYLLADAPNPAAPAPFNTTDFARFNPGRLFGTYRPASGDAAHGMLSANLVAGTIGFVAKLDSAKVVNGDANGNGQADVGEGWTLTAPIASYDTAGGPPLTDADLSRYTMRLDGKVTSVTSDTVGATTVSYAGTFTLRYTGPTFPDGVEVEAGTFTLQALYWKNGAGAAQLTARLVAVEGASQSAPPFDQTDFAIFNPGRFTGTYTPSGDGTTGRVSGSLVGGALGFTATTGLTVTNNDTNGNGRADVGETFSAAGLLEAYQSLGGPVLTDFSTLQWITLNNYWVTLNGTVTKVDGDVVTYGSDPAKGYASTFTISYRTLGTETVVETGTFEVAANYGTDGAHLSGTLRAEPGWPDNVPFDSLDLAAFNPITFTGTYVPTKPNEYRQQLNGTLLGGTMVRPIVSRYICRQTSAAPTTAALDDGTRLVVVAGEHGFRDTDGTTVYRPRLFVVDATTLDDAPGWRASDAPDGFPGKPLEEVTFARPTVYRDDVYLACGSALYRFNLKTGQLVGFGHPVDSNYNALPQPAVVSGALSGEVGDHVIVGYYLKGGDASKLVKLSVDNLGSPIQTTQIQGDVRALAVPGSGYVFLSGNKGIATLDYATLTVKNIVPEFSGAIPLVVGDKLYVATGFDNGRSDFNFRRVSIATGNTEDVFPLGSRLNISPFYEKRTNLIQAALEDGRVLSFSPTGAFVGQTLPGLFNSRVGGTMTMPVVTHDILYHSAAYHLFSGVPPDGDDQQAVEIANMASWAIAATGQDPAKDRVILITYGGLVQSFPVR